jgi:hypothetical protein
VTDESGALLPGARIEAKSHSAKQIHVADASDSGEYRLCVPAGVYDVKAAMNGFKPGERKSISVGQPGHPGNPTVDFVLKVDASKINI